MVRGPDRGAGLPAWYAREVLADEQEKEVAARKRIGPNDQIVMGAIGVGGQGTGIMKGAMKQGASSSSPSATSTPSRRDKAAKDVGKRLSRKYNDFRELLAKRRPRRRHHRHARPLARPDLDRRDEGAAATSTARSR